MKVNGVLTVIRMLNQIGLMMVFIRITIIKMTMQLFEYQRIEYQKGEEKA